MWSNTASQPNFEKEALESVGVATQFERFLPPHSPPDEECLIRAHIAPIFAGH